MTNEKHTPTPWGFYSKDDMNIEIYANPQIGHIKYHDEICTIEHARSIDIAATAKANAAYIVKAVNCHDDLYDVVLTLKNKIDDGSVKVSDRFAKYVNDTLKKAQV